MDFCKYKFLENLERSKGLISDDLINFEDDMTPDRQEMYEKHEKLKLLMDSIFNRFCKLVNENSYKKGELQITCYCRSCIGKWESNNFMVKEEDVL